MGTVRMAKKVDDWINDQLSNNNLVFVLWTGTATFMAYFSMYMYRKPFTSAKFEELSHWNIDYKILIVIAQVAGYALSKFAGIKIISELKSTRRIPAFIFLMITSWLGLVGFAFSPFPMGILWLFINGLPLGLIWGIVFSYCEGRKLTEVLTVVLSVNFILSSGFAKTLGTYILQAGFSEQMMPMIAGIMAMPLLILSIWMLTKIPPPTREEIALKNERKPMDKTAQKKFIFQYWFPTTLFVLIYLALTIVRDIRDNFAPEIWSQLGYSNNAGIFSAAELPVAIVMLISIGLLYQIRDNYKALQITLTFTAFGIFLLLFITMMFQLKLISGVYWMVISGIGLFLPYILLNGIIFDRFIAAFRITANVGFIMYIADAIGYLGSVVVLILKNFGSSRHSWINFYQEVCLGVGIPAFVLSLILFLYFPRLNREKIKPADLADFRRFG